MKALTFRLQLEEPVLVSQALTGEENSAIGMPFIPGSALRGVLADRYLRSHPSADLAADPDARRLFFDGTVCFLNAYPWYEGVRTLPKPMSWFTEKNDFNKPDARIYDLAIDRDPHHEQIKPPAGEFCRLLYEDAGSRQEEDEEYSEESGETQGSACFISPRRNLNVHIALEDANCRSDQNKVFRYDSLAQRQTFGGVIVSRNGDDLRLLMELLGPPDLRIGAARTAGYGRVGIESPRIEPGWNEYEPGPVPDDGRIVVTLLSDVVVRGANGQVDGDLDSAFGLTPGMSALKHEWASHRLKLVAGYNRKWGLPLRQDWAVAAGSVYVYPPGSVDVERLQELAARGIGERRAEGFGRFAVNWHTTNAVMKHPPVKSPGNLPSLSPASKRMAATLAQRRLRILLERKLAEAVNGVDLGKPLPQNSQLSRVQTAVLNARQSRNMQGVIDHLNSLKGARKQLERAKVGGLSMFYWLVERVKRSDVEVQLLRSAPLPSIAGESARMTEDFKLEYTARLIDGVMRKARKLNQSDRSNREEAV